MSERLIFGRNFAFQNGLGLTRKTASTNSPWAYIWLIIGRIFASEIWGGLFLGGLFFGGGGGLIVGILRYLTSDF